ncbi:MAG: phosphodiester glycosidase family protein [Candidatus Melainabacteria bacterium]|nr:phosphodiester glycosidase family protein [Candidatus Melainabacteria bacterium]
MSALLLCGGSLWAESVVTVRGLSVEPGPLVTRLTLTLDKPAPEEVTVSETALPEPLLVRFAGKLSGSVQQEARRLANQPPWERSALKALEVREMTDNQVLVAVFRAYASEVQVYALEDPYRLIVDLSVRESVGGTPEWMLDPGPLPGALPGGLGSGVVFRTMPWKLPQGRMRVNVLEVDPLYPGVRVTPALATRKLSGLAPLPALLKREASALAAPAERVVAGINASFFKPDLKIPLGLLVIDGELLTGPIFNRTVLGIGADRSLQMARLQLEGTVTLGNGQRIAIDTVNQPRVRLDQTVLYSDAWGQQAPPVPKGGVQLQVLQGVVMAVSQTQALPIPPHGFVLSGPMAAMAPALQNAVGGGAVIQTYTVPDWSAMRHVMSGGPQLVKDGQVFVDATGEHFQFHPSRHYAARTALGILPNGRLLMLTVEADRSAGGQGDHRGVSLIQLAHLLKALGATQAMNLDGGGSTQMVVNNQLVTRSQGAWLRPISTGLVVYSKEPVTYLPPSDAWLRQLALR